MKKALKVLPFMEISWEEADNTQVNEKFWLVMSIIKKKAGLY